MPYQLKVVKLRQQMPNKMRSIKKENNDGKYYQSKKKKKRITSFLLGENGRISNLLSHLMVEKINSHS